MTQLSVSAGIGRKVYSSYERMKQLIVESQIPPNQKILPRVVASLFDVSISPVRDALSRLAAEGYVHHDAGSGYYTKPCTTDEQRDLLEHIYFIFSGSTAKVGGFLPRGLLTEAARLDFSLDGGELAYVEKMAELFLGVVKATHNEAVLATARILMDRTFAATLVDCRITSDFRSEVSVLRGIALALLDSDVAKANAVARDYIDGRISRLPDVVRIANQRAAESTFP